MGAKNSRAANTRPRAMKFHLVGPRNSGKTYLLYRMNTGEMPDFQYPINDDYIQGIDYKGERFVGWETGGRDRVRAMFRAHALRNSNAIIYVIDSTDTEKLDEAWEQLDREILQREELANRVVMVLANKQDLDGALGPEEIEAQLRQKCPTISFGISVLVMPCSVVTGEGIWEAFDLFLRLVKEKIAEKEKKEGAGEGEGRLITSAGLIPRAWELPNEEPDNNDEETDEDGDDDVMKVKDEIQQGDTPAPSEAPKKKIKKSWYKLKDPFKVLKSILTC